MDRMLTIREQSFRKLDCTIDLFSRQRRCDQRPQRHPIEAVRILHSMPELQRFISQFLAIIESCLFPSDPGKVRLRHRNVLDHSNFGCELKRFSGAALGFFQVSSTSIRDRQISKAPRFDDKIAAASRQLERRVGVLDRLGKVASKKLNESKNEANVRGL